MVPNFLAYFFNILCKNVCYHVLGPWCEIWHCLCHVAGHCHVSVSVPDVIVLISI